MTAAQRETADTVTLELAALDGAGRPFAPGQFNMVWAFGVGEVPLSICGDPAEPGTLVHTVRAVGAVTRAICAARPGDVLGVRGPFGRPWPLDAAQGGDVLLVGGGIGLAPLRPVVRHVLARRAAFGRVFVLYGARTPADLLYADELQALRARFDMEVEVTVDAADAAWRGNVGPVTILIPGETFDPERTTAFICGPHLMVHFVAGELAAAGVPPARTYVAWERNMHCGIGLCGHCQLGPKFVCRDGPVFALPELVPAFRDREL